MHSGDYEPVPGGKTQEEVNEARARASAELQRKLDERQKKIRDGGKKDK